MISDLFQIRYNLIRRYTSILVLSLFPFLLREAVAYSELENFIRVLGSLDSHTSTVGYINGSVFWKGPDADFRKLFNFEGYNINRKIRQSDGTFLSLSREFVVYREPVASQILQVWMNPSTRKPNEVFYVANDPVNGVFDGPTPSFPLPSRNPVYDIYNTDVVLEYPNPLTPDNYPRFSAGDIYDSVELFGFFANSTLLHSSTDISVPYIATWMRKSEYLPWMEMGRTPGTLYYTTLSWKCNSGLSCVSDDIMQLINNDYPKYRTAPTTREDPNETSWTVFKKVIDQRREAGLPDIIIPPVNVSTNSKPMVYEVDSRVEDILYNWPLYVYVEGTAWSEIPGNQSVVLFDMKGNVGLAFDPIPEEGGYRLQLDGFLSYYNHSTNMTMTKFYNPITGQVNNVSRTRMGTDLVFDRNSLYTIDVPEAQAVGLVGGQAVSDNDTGTWAVNLMNFVFPYIELAKPTKSASFFGTYAIFQSWPDWMQMSDVNGNIVMKFSVTNSREIY